MLETLACTYENLQLHTQELVKKIQQSPCPITQNALYHEFQIIDRQLQKIEHQLCFIIEEKDASI